MADGPRALRPNEWEQLDQVVSEVFRPEMFHDYPQLFNEANRENLRVVAEDGKVVCHVGMTERPASLAGCRIDVACIGAVSTLDAYRGRGFASAAFQDACDKAAADGIDVMLISGGRGLYTRVGCRAVGRDRDLVLDAATSRGLDNARPPGPLAFSLAQLGPEHIDAMRALYQMEPVRFLRPRGDWEMAFDCGIVMNTPSHFWGVWAGSLLAAYLIVHDPAKARRRNPDDPTVTRVVEFAGQRAAIASAIPRLLDHYRTDRLTLHVQGWDPLLGTVLLLSTGVEGTPSHSSGTLRVINFPQLMERCRPLLAERIGGAAAGSLAFEAEAPPGSASGGFTIRRGSDAVRLPDLAALAQFVFGTHTPPETTPEGSSDLLALLSRALPLPALWYGISYV
jgi:predicted N-acetyltransferase YhbS